MALLYMDSFDHYATADIAEKWSTITGAPTISTGRRSTNGLRTNVATSTAQTGVLPVSGTTAVVGVAVKLVTLGSTTRTLLSVRATGGSQMSLALNASGVIEAHTGDSASLLSATTATLTVGTYYYLELKTVIHSSAGTVAVRVNGTSVLSLTGVNTASAGTAAGWTSLRLGSQGTNGSAFDFDDLYVLDGSGAAPVNDFLGDCRVDARYATGAGATTGWTPSTGSNYQNVDETAPDDDTTYNSAAASGLTDTFVTQDAPVAGATIYGMQVNLNMKKTDAGACTVAPVIRHSGTDQVGTSLSPGTSYAYGLAVYATNPGTSAAWTETEFNNAEFGYKRTA